MSENRPCDPVIRLYVAGNGPNSTVARDNLRAICRRQIGAEAPVEIIDVEQDPERALADNVLYTPMLIVGSGQREQRFLGNLNRDAAVIRAIASALSDVS